MSKNKTSAYERLTPKQRAFVDEMLVSGSASKAVQAAGYCPGGNRATQDKHARKLLKSQSIKDAIAEHFDAFKEQRNGRIYCRMRWLEDFVADNKNPANLRLKAIEMLIRVDGGFIDRTEISGPEGGSLVFNIIRPEKDESETIQLEDDAKTS